MSVCLSRLTIFADVSSEEIKHVRTTLLLHPFNGLFSRTTWVSRYQKGTSLDLNQARDNGVFGWQWHQLDHMQTICTSPQTDTEAKTRGWGLGRAKPSQLLKLAPTKHDGRSSATCELPHKIFACWRFSHSRAGAAISRTLAILNSAGTNFINYLLKVKVRTE